MEDELNPRKPLPWRDGSRADDGRPEGAESSRSVLLIGVGALITAWLSLLCLPGAGFGEGFEAVHIARTVAEGGGFANPFPGRPTGPTAHLPPLFPLLLAALFRLLGFASLAIAFASSLCLTAHVLHSMLLVPMAAILVGSHRVGAWAALVAMVAPPLLVLPQWEGVYAAAGLMLFCLGSHRWSVAGGLSAGSAARCGAAAGALALLNASTPLVIGTWLLWLAGRLAAPAKVRVKFLFLTAIFAGLAVSPWILRNWLVLGALVPLRSNFGLELAVSNNPWAFPSQRENFRRPHVARLHPTFGPEIREEIRREGEIAFNRRKWAEALEWIRGSKAAFLKLTAARVAQFWWPVHEISGFHIFAVRLVTLAVLAGMVVMVMRHEPAAWFLAGASVLFSLPYAVLHVSTRLRFPIMWLSLLGAGYFLDWATQALRSLCRCRM